MKTAEFGIIIPCYNEENNIPTLLRNLELNIPNSIPVIFVNNNSTDSTYIIIGNFIEKYNKTKWNLINEKVRGRVHAISSGALFLIKHNPSIRSFVSFDADNSIDSLWNSNATELSERLTENNYGYGMFTYTDWGISNLFSQVYKAYDCTLENIMRFGYWFGTGPHSYYTIENYKKINSFFQDNVLEEDLRFSLFLLYLGKIPMYSNSKIHTSARRIIKNQNSFEKWCFYDDSFYTQKFLEKEKSIDKKYAIKRTSTLHFSEKDIPLFFYRRSKKLVLRNIIPLLCFTKDNKTREKMIDYLNIDSIIIDYVNQIRKNVFLDILRDNHLYQNWHLKEVLSKDEFFNSTIETLDKKMDFFYRQNK